MPHYSGIFLFYRKLRNYNKPANIGVMLSSMLLLISSNVLNISAENNVYCEERGRYIAWRRRFRKRMR